MDYIQMTQIPFPKDLNKFMVVTKPSSDYFQECLKRVSTRLLTKPSKQEILEEVNESYLFSKCKMIIRFTKLGIMGEFLNLFFSFLNEIFS